MNIFEKWVIGNWNRSKILKYNLFMNVLQSKPIEKNSKVWIFYCYDVSVCIEKRKHRRQLQTNFRNIVFFAGAQLARIWGALPNPSSFGEGFSDPSSFCAEPAKIKIFWHFICYTYIICTCQGGLEPINSRSLRSPCFLSSKDPIFWGSNLNESLWIPFKKILF